jgi:hypothetical protein
MGHAYQWQTDNERKNMKLSALFTSLSICSHSSTHPIELCDGDIEITPSMIPTLTPRDLGSRAAECIARIAGRVRLASYTFHAAPPGVGSMRDSSHSGEALGSWNGSSWRVDGDGTWRKYGPAATAIFGGNSSVRAFVANVELSDSDATHIVAAIDDDNHERRKRVVWRPRPNQFVMRICHLDGRYHSTDVLMPDGAVRTCLSPEGPCILSELPGGYDSLRDDPVWGRSEVDHVRGNTHGTWTRVVGWRAYRRLLHAERQFLAAELPREWSRTDLRRVIEAHHAPHREHRGFSASWLKTTAREVCPHATQAQIEALAPLNFDGRDRRVVELLDAMAAKTHVLS